MFSFIPKIIVQKTANSPSGIEEKNVIASLTKLMLGIDEKMLILSSKMNGSVPDENEYQNIVNEIGILKKDYTSLFLKYYKPIAWGKVSKISIGENKVLCSLIIEIPMFAHESMTVEIRDNEFHENETLAMESIRALTNIPELK